MRIRPFEPLHPMQLRSDCPRRLQKRRTIRTEILSRREELIDLRDEGWTIDELGQAYQERLEAAGWPCVSRSYLIKVISEVSKDAFPRRQTSEFRDSVPENPQESAEGLIPVFRANIGGVEVDAVNARDLHAFLEVGKDFSNWVKDRIDRFGFVENQDFVCSPILASKDQPAGRGGHNRLDYILTLDMAKELSMVERTPKGKQARQYFIEIERRYYAGERPAPAETVHHLPESTGTAALTLPDGADPVEDAPVDSEAVMDFLARAVEPDASQWKQITFLDPFLPMPLHRFLALAQQIYVALENTRPAPSDLMALRREAIEEAARISRARLQSLADAFGGSRRAWLVWSRK